MHFGKEIKIINILWIVWLGLWGLLLVLKELGFFKEFPIASNIPKDCLVFLFMAAMVYIPFGIAELWLAKDDQDFDIKLSDIPEITTFWVSALGFDVLRKRKKKE